MVLSSDIFGVNIDDAASYLESLDLVVIRSEGLEVANDDPRLPPGWYSTDLWTSFGLRFIDEARAEILQQLAGARADRAYQRLVTEARSRYAVELFDGNLPFAYKGSFPITRPYDKS